ncbi:MAG: 3-hydroxyacyl-CoA dehydrogenase [Actinomycetota bacterium]|nr:3-hydroxyacyl-CoA dehydrogenase [Actinomycetota bacterium]
MTDPLPPERAVGVVGAGTMGAGIAQVAATYGHRVLLHDTAPGAAEAAVEAVRTRLDAAVNKGRLDTAAAAAIAGRIVAASSLDELAEVGLVIEAVVERLDVKRELFAKLEALVAADAVLATNTSSLSVTAIAAGLDHPQRVVGMHFFNPAPVMALVEVVSGDATAAAVADTTAATATAWGKTPVHCTSTPGFIVNRVARPFYGEALRLLAEGAADAATIDAVVTEAGGFRMGPFALMDLVGLDVNLAVSRSVYEQTFGDTRFAPNVIQQGLVDAGRLGRKTGRGFHDYSAEAVPVAPAILDGSGPAPAEVVVVGEPGHAAALVDRIAASGVPVRREAGDGGPGRLLVGDAVVVPTDGTTATELAARLGVTEVAVLDLVGDGATAARVAVADADQAQRRPGERFAAAVAPARLAVSAVGDTPGLVVMRIVAQLASVAADAVTAGVADPGDVDIAMRLGTSYPKGPLAWAEEIGVATVVGVLDRLRAFYGEDRYRVASRLRRAALVAPGPTP